MSNYRIEFPNMTDGSLAVKFLMRTATCYLQFSLHFSLHVRVNVNFVLNPIHHVARGAGDEIAELSNIFLHVASRGVAYEGKAQVSPGELPSDETRTMENAKHGGEGSDSSRTLSVSAAVSTGRKRGTRGESLLHPQSFPGIFSTP